MILLEDLDYIYNMALQKREYEQQKCQLESKIQSENCFEQMQEQRQISLNWKSMIVVFVIVEFIITKCTTGIINKILTLQANGWRSEEEVYATGIPYYRNIEIIWPVGALVAVPFTVLVIFLICMMIKIINGANNAQISKRNQIKVKHNETIRLNNEKVIEQNNQYINQINAINELELQLLEEFREKGSWYPEEYFFLEAVEYIRKEIQSGHAASITEAIVFYEGSRAV